jgi:hypothetical protein
MTPRAVAEPVNPAPTKATARTPAKKAAPKKRTSPSKTSRSKSG